MSKSIEKDINIHIGKKIREFRSKKGLTMIDIADHFEFSHQQIHKYEKGTNNISAAKLHELSILLMKDISAFYPNKEYFNEDADNAINRNVFSLIKHFQSIEDESLRLHIIDLVRGLSTSLQGE